MEQRNLTQANIEELEHEEIGLELGIHVSDEEWEEHWEDFDLERQGVLIGGLHIQEEILSARACNCPTCKDKLIELCEWAEIDPETIPHRREAAERLPELREQINDFMWQQD